MRLQHQPSGLQPGIDGLAAARATFRSLLLGPTHVLRRTQLTIHVDLHIREFQLDRSELVRACIDVNFQLGKLSIGVGLELLLARTLGQSLLKLRLALLQLSFELAVRVLLASKCC